MKSLAVVLLGASDERRRLLAEVVTGTQARILRQGPLPDRDELGAWVDNECDVLIIDVDHDQETALDLVETACGRNSALTVMVYSRQGDQGLLLRAMRAGAREFLVDPLTSGSVAEALVRASIRREEVGRQKKVGGRMTLFVGAKGGSGTTTLAANYAVLLARESKGKVVLLDLQLELGDAALNLGLSSPFSSVDALRNERRLDADLLATMFVEHSSGLRVLASADRMSQFQPSPAAVLKLVTILKNGFDYVVVDAGTDYADYIQALFDVAEKICLVAQVSVADLRNCRRIIETHFTGPLRPKLEVVLNRFSLRPGEIDAATITKALTVSPTWKVPGDFAAVRQAQNTASAVALKDGPITRELTNMARAMCGETAPEGKKRRFGLF